MFTRTIQASPSLRFTPATSHIHLGGISSCSTIHAMYDYLMVMFCVVTLRRLTAPSLFSVQSLFSPLSRCHAVTAVSLSLLSPLTFSALSCLRCLVSLCAVLTVLSPRVSLRCPVCAVSSSLSALSCLRCVPVSLSGRYMRQPGLRMRTHNCTATVCCMILR